MIRIIQNRDSVLICDVFRCFKWSALTRRYSSKRHLTFLFYLSSERLDKSIPKHPDMSRPVRFVRDLRIILRDSAVNYVRNLRLRFFKLGNSFEILIIT